MKKIFIIILTLSFFYILSAESQIAIFVFDDRSGEIRPQSKIIEEEIKKSISDVTIQQYSAKGNEHTAIEIVKAIDNEGFDLVIVITTDATRFALLFMKNTPFLFTNCNNPEFMGIDMVTRKRNFSGVTYYVPLKDQLNLFKNIMTHSDNVGFIFDNNSLSRKYELRESRDFCDKNNLNFKVELITNSSEVENAAKKLIKKGVDAIVLTTSGTVYNETKKVTKLAFAKRIPVFSYNKKGVKLGAVASLSSDYTRMNSELLPDMVKQIIVDKKPANSLPIRYLKDPYIYLNKKSIAQLNYTIDPEIMNKAISFE